MITMQSWFENEHTYNHSVIVICYYDYIIFPNNIIVYKKKHFPSVVEQI